MDPCSHKIYHVCGFDPKPFLEHYYSGKSKEIFKEDFPKFAIENLTKAFEKSQMKDVIIDFSLVPLVPKGLAAMKGKSDQSQDKGGKVKVDVQNVTKENMKDLPPADYVTSAWLLEVICKDKDDYIRHVRNITEKMKPGGCLILIGCLNMTYYTVGKEKFDAFPYNEEFAKKVLVGEGLVIDYCKVKQRAAVSDHTDYKAMMFIAAHKEK